MGNRIDLHKILCEVLGSKNVYFQPPESVKMKYPAIVYSLSRIENRNANNSVYKQNNAYDVILIDSDPENETINRISRLPLCRFDRYYVSNNLNHYAFTLYF